MKWLMAILAALVVIEAGVGTCTSAAHAAPAAGAVSAHAMSAHAMSSDDAAQPCHDAAAGHGSHAMAADADHDMNAADPVAECCASGACADCALVNGMPGADPDGYARFAAGDHILPGPATAPGRPLAHDPPPPRA